MVCNVDINDCVNYVTVDREGSGVENWELDFQRAIMARWRGNDDYGPSIAVKSALLPVIFCYLFIFLPIILRAILSRIYFNTFSIFS